MQVREFGLHGLHYCNPVQATKGAWPAGGLREFACAPLTLSHLLN